jgi:ABC-type phosphate/phosphonate transport system substrate-binding protein
MEQALYSSDATDTTIATNMIIKKVTNLMGMESEVKFYIELENLKDDLSANRLDGVFVNILDFFTIEHLVHPDYIYALTLGPDSFDKTLLVTRKDLNITKLEDLRGGSISIPDGYFLGRKYLDLELAKRKLPRSERFFKSVLEAEDINASLIDLFFGKADCALATDVSFKITAELNEQLIEDLQVLLTSKEMIPQVIAMNKNIPPNILKKVNFNIVNAHKNKHIMKLFSLFRAKKIAKVEQEHLEENRRLLLEYEALTQE